MIFKKILANNYSYNLLVKIVSLSLSIIGGALFTRFLGASLKGELAALESISFVASVVMNFGIYHLYPKYKRDNVEDAKQKFIDIIFFISTLYLLIDIIAFIIIKDLMVIFYGLLAITACFTAQIMMIGMVEIPKTRSRASLIQSFFNAILCVSIFFSNFERELAIPIIVYILHSCLFCAIVLYKLNVLPHIFQIDFRLLKILIKLGFIPMLTALLLKLNYKVDIIMLNIFGVSNTNIGVYAVAVSVAAQMWIIPESFKEILYSKATLNNISQPYVLAMKFSTYALLLIEFIMLLIGSWIILFLYGVEFAYSYNILIILMVGIPFMGIFNIVNPYYLSTGQYSIHLKNLALGVICNIIVNTIVISRFQSYGAALATSASQIVCGLYAVRQFCKSSHITPKEIFYLKKQDIQFVIGRKF